MSIETKHDINNRADISLLITSFYVKVQQDASLSPLFQHIDWEHHTPIIIDFWEMILLGGQNFHGNPFAKHLKLPLEAKHFKQWVQIFTHTVDEYFAGEKATEAKLRAKTMADMFQYRLGLLSYAS